MQPVSAANKTDLIVLPDEDAQAVAAFFQVLADPTRVRLVRALADGRWCVSDLAHALDMDQPAISHQLKYLRKLRLVMWEKSGRHVYYTLDHPLLRAMLFDALHELEVKQAE